MPTEMNEVLARERLQDALQSLIAVHMKWDHKKSRDWMCTENPFLGGAIPRYLIMTGRSHKVLAFIEAAISENKPPA